MVALACHFSVFKFLQQKCIHQADGVAASRQASSAIDGCGVPSLPAGAQLYLRGKE